MKSLLISTWRRAGVLVHRFVRLILVRCNDPEHSTINAERSEARGLRKAWIKADDENQRLRKELETAIAAIRLAHEWGSNGVKGYSATKAEIFAEAAKNILSNRPRSGTPNRRARRG
jgi:hypothetical protein